MSFKIICPQCEAMAIQGVACHETGCRLKEVPWVQRKQGFDYPVMFPEDHPPEYLRKTPKVKNKS